MFYISGIRKGYFYTEIRGESHQAAL